MREGSEHPEQAESGEVQRSVLAAMPKRDRDILIGFGFLIAAFTVSALWHVTSYNQDQRSHRQRAASYEIAKNESIAECQRNPSTLGRVTCLAEKVVTEQQQERSRADLHAQQDMATWALGLFWIGLLGVITSVGGVFLIYATLTETRRMTTTTSKIGRDQSRAYLHIELTGIERIAVGEINGVKANFALINSGATPAKDIRVGTSVQIAGISKFETFYEPIPENWRNTGVVSGNDKKTGGWLVQIPVDQLNLMRETLSSQNPVTHEITVSIIVRYSDIFGERFESHDLGKSWTLNFSSEKLSPTEQVMPTYQKVGPQH